MVDATNFDQLSHVELVKEAWNILVKYYEGGEKVKDYVSKVQNPFHLMKGCGEVLIDKMIVEKVMCTLTSHFYHVILSIQESNNFTTLKLEDLVSSLEAHELRIVERKKVQGLIQAIQAHILKKHGGSNKFKGKGDKTQSKKSLVNPQKDKVADRTSESLKRGKGTSYQKDKQKMKNVKCYNFEKCGHLAKSCWYKKDNGTTQGKDDEGATLAHQDSDDSYGMVFMVVVADEHVDNKTWFLDKGCSNHMTG
ncbi:uncharacterized protein LOC127130315 [Lathyrus oleraceus]|uniref:uncharacterized protein LOC127130315 n=1 Tax=Pisum sativum TaxID=3888 RepID=UPI0021D29FB3|nr:uncharacterized protein LOC127130315 [Pisum sativum]